jgi:hypothetical protein
MMSPTCIVLFDLRRLDIWMIIERLCPPLLRHDQERLPPNANNGHTATLPEPWARRTRNSAINGAVNS